MAKRKKCRECEKCMNWALPQNVVEGNLDYAKQCLEYAAETIVCSRTMRIKPVEHEQYCNYFSEKTDADRKMENAYYNHQIPHLKQMIEDFEKEKGRDQMHKGKA